MPTPNDYTFLDGLLRGNAGGGDVSGPVSSVTDNIVTFQNTTGKVVKDSGVSISALIRANGSVAFSADQSMGNHRLTNLLTPTSANHAATKAYVDSVAGSGVTADGVTLQLISSVMSVKTNGIANVNFRQSGAASLVGRAANSTGDVADIAVGADETIVRSGGVLVSAKISAINIAAAAAIALTQLAPGTGLSLVGRAASSGGSNADIVAASDYQVMRRSGATIGFGAIDLSQAAAVTGQLALASVANGTACSIVGRAANSTGALGLISVGSDGDVVMRTAGVVASGKVANANVDAAAAIAGTKISPDFGAQNVLTTGYFGGVDNPAIGGTGSALTVRAGNATGPSGTRTGGALTLTSGTGSSAAGDLFIQRGGVTVVGANFASTFVDSLNQIVLRHNSVTINLIDNTGLTNYAQYTRWASTVASPTLTQVDSTATSGVGAPMTIGAQNAFGDGGTGGALTVRAGDATGASGTRTGGALTLRSGTGAAVAGNVTVQRGAVSVLASTASSTTVGEATLSDIVLGSNASLRLNGNVMMTWGSTIQIVQSAGVLEYANGLTPTFRQASSAAGGATGGSFLINAQDVSGTGASAGSMTIRAGDASGVSGTRNGGAFILRSGTGATSIGNLTLQRGSLPVFIAEATSSATKLTIGPTDGAVYIRAGGAVDYSIYHQFDLGLTKHTADSIQFHQSEAASASTVAYLSLAGNTFLRCENVGGAPQLAFFGAGTTAPKPTVTGSRGGNAALASLLTGLASLGLLVNSSS